MINLDTYCTYTQVHGTWYRGTVTELFHSNSMKQNEMKYNEMNRMMSYSAKHSLSTQSTLTSCIVTILTTLIKVSQSLCNFTTLFISKSVPTSPQPML
ncbi:hypothetical protein T310_1413 [Rasamsonia emersonii CBS 393.64]|uniref:Uncharacterized protein n=1 Tax=Rasamsonia emersonii (strain ATCC 16479 / CBS 393.64 / IMI 116815) TaxID=1408163 RepID=A0A0F4Z1W9_RASE3|nr:hypothetical protein T310_1413 [Rasamsonia emersonii CBS 393.64]KKA24512.1 hypothetical protein T310_1413 [Rasamsonia emersonii CBS 393.64]